MNNVDIAFISHGGGPMPLLNEPNHTQLVAYLKSLASTLKKPSAILLISAHWEESVATITANAAPAQHLAIGSALEIQRFMQVQLGVFRR
ncbi:hypothetical protein H5187_14920 [Pseudoalteromonas sp. SG44-1]|uniref:hypothetical protein n=1 Tax=Pseudoalteromonas sp. SG44-1 TaxID=2760964 RepID=UPI0015FF1BC7|nr:hypothetical protein [Pseudoalteromonas sp. SG44-1]MBB1418569.1 hypothetical protein [Pseudoalteromonas sp. SG44-1]